MYPDKFLTYLSKKTYLVDINAKVLLISTHNNTIALHKRITLINISSYFSRKKKMLEAYQIFFFFHFSCEVCFSHSLDVPQLTSPRKHIVGLIRNSLRNCLDIATDKALFSSEKC